MSSVKSLAVMSALVLAGLSAPARAADLRVSHSGFLLGVNDVPLDSPGVALAFRLVDRANPDVAEVTAWSGTCTVPVAHGYFTVTLGDGTCGSNLTDLALPYGLPRFLEVSVGGTALAPRLRLEALPNAAFASDAGSVGGQSLTALDSRYLRVQAGTPSAQAGSVAVTGSVSAGSISGLGSGLTGLDASHLSTGTLANARLSSDVPLLASGTLPDSLLSANVPLLSSGRLSTSVLPLGVVLDTGAQTIGGNKLFSGLTSFGNNIDLTSHELIGARLQNAASAPITCDASNLGRLYFDTAANAMRVCRASSWSTILDAASNSGGQLASYTTATRPTGVNPGYVIYNSTTMYVELWNGTRWVKVGGGSGAIEATGGTVTTVGNYRVHKFTNSAPFVVTSADPGLNVEVLVVGGGGGGAFWFAGGGGGGGVVYATSVPVTVGTVSVTVGQGGTGLQAAGGSGQGAYGLRGGDSSFGSGLIARGGGGGPGHGAAPSNSGEYQYTDGGSGGGGRGGSNGAEGRTGRTYSSVATVGNAQIFGNHGGAMGGNWGGGGGGAGAVGGSGTVDGKGGDGISFNLDGNATYYGAGGGGGTSSGTSQGGLGGGGTGSTGQGGHATGYGNGGGSGGSGASSGVTGGNGSSGIVIVRYPLNP